MVPVIPKTESLTVEFKSDKKRLSDRDLVEAVVCMTNTDGGDIYLGVEDDSTPTGLHPEHMNVVGMAALIANRTIPPVSVRVEPLDVKGVRVAKISVPRSPRPVSTSDGVLQRRRTMADGKPQCVPFYPHEFVQRESSLGVLDYSALPISGTGPEDFDPLERERLRQMIARYGGDGTLAGLDDRELEGALGFVRRENGHQSCTVAGLLVLGRESSLKEKLPSHEVAFQVLQDMNVKVNEFYRTPLLKTFERVMDQFSARVNEEEIQEGLFRIPIPNFDKRGFREAFVNALIHRDYTRLGATHVRMESGGIIVSNPGGFVEGVTLHNILIVEPKPRNPLLADAIKRIGLAERTGRGVDLIYQGMLRYGRPEPDYSRSDNTGVVVQLSSSTPDLDFLRMVIAVEKKTNAPMPLDSLIILSRLRKERRLSVTDLAPAVQKNESSTRAVLERLAEAGLVEAHGVKKGRTYTLSANVYGKMGKTNSYIRQVGFDSIQQEEMVLRYVAKNKIITRKQAADLCRISDHQASHLLRKLNKNNKLKMIGKGRGSCYKMFSDQ